MKVELDLPEKPEVYAIAQATGLPVDAVTGKLLRVWAWFDRHTSDGVAAGINALFIDGKAGHVGFAEAMTSVKWLKTTASGVVIPKFDKHNGKSAKNRAETTARVQRHRAEKRWCNESVTEFVTENLLPREEKRREEDIKDMSEPSGSSSTGVDFDLTPADTSEQAKQRKREDKARRLSVVSDEAIAAYNAILAKPAGLLPKVSGVNIEKRRREVERCLKVASRICQQTYESPQVTAEFWTDYFTSCSEDEYFSGRRSGYAANPDWKPDFEFLTREDQMAKVFERVAEA